MKNILALLVLLVLFSIVCHVVLNERHHHDNELLHYAYAATPKPPLNVPGDCRAVINAYRKWKSEKLQPLAAATAEQEREANQYAKIGAQEYKTSGKVLPARSNRLAMNHLSDKSPNAMIGFYNDPIPSLKTAFEYGKELIFGTTYKSVACGNDGNFNVADFYK